jgi:hypothetical protein
VTNPDDQPRGPKHVSTLRGWLKSRRRFFAGTTFVFALASAALGPWWPWSALNDLRDSGLGAQAVVALIAGSLALAGSLVVIWSAGLVYLAMTPHGPMARLVEKADDEPADCLALFPSEHAVLEEYDLAVRTVASLKARKASADDPTTREALDAAQDKVRLLERRVQMLVLDRVFGQLRVTFERELRRTLAGAGVAVIGFWWYIVLAFG